ncbi:hypothetical protein, partial [Vibrio sp. S9_S30]|uniref:hypothetical protein n=1 Tax=Vibrio sp. S9_S30 TaxID=2720226 RepID=UPI001EEDE444
ENSWLQCFKFRFLNPNQVGKVVASQAVVTISNHSCLPYFEVWFSARSCKFFDWFGVLGFLVWLQKVLLARMLFIECKRSASLPSKSVCWYRSNKSFKPTNNAWHF